MLKERKKKALSFAVATAFACTVAGIAMPSVQAAPHEHGEYVDPPRVIHHKTDRPREGCKNQNFDHEKAHRPEVELDNPVLQREMTAEDWARDAGKAVCERKFVYHSASPLRAQRESAERNWEAHVQKLLEEKEKSDPKYGANEFNKGMERIRRLLAGEDVPGETSKPYHKKFVYDHAPVYMNGELISEKPLYKTIHAFDSVDSAGLPGKMVVVQYDYVRFWRESTVSKVGILGNMTSYHFFPNEQGDQFDYAKLDELK